MALHTQPFSLACVTSCSENHVIGDIINCITCHIVMECNLALPFSVKDNVVGIKLHCPSHLVGVDVKYTS